MSIATRIFHDAVLERRKYPLLRGGRYKLQETADRMHRDSRTIDEMIEYSHRKQGPSIFPTCAWSDKAQWLRHVLRDVPYQLGYNVTPAIDALVFDGVDKPQLASLKSWARQQTHSLLSQVDSALSLTQKSLNAEYSLWKENDSMIRVLLDRAVNLADEIITYADERLPLHGVSEQMTTDWPSSLHPGV